MRVLEYSKKIINNNTLIVKIYSVVLNKKNLAEKTEEKKKGNMNNLVLKFPKVMKFFKLLLLTYLNNINR